MNELISVIVPIYKTEQYLTDCIESIRNQTYKNLEIILVNDGSPDNSLSICEKFAAKDPRIKIVNRKNGGLSAARNSGLEVATGEYVAFIDSDDYIEPHMYQLLLEQLKLNKVDIMQCGWTAAEELIYLDREPDPNDYNLHFFSWREAIIDLLDSTHNFTCSVWNKLYKKEIFDKIKFTDVRSEDFVIHYQILRGTEPRIARIDTELYHYIKRQASITTGRLNEANVKFIDLIREMEKEEKDPELLEHWKVQLAVSGRNIIVRQIVSGDFPERFKGLRNDMVSAKPVLKKSEYKHIDKSLKFHVKLIAFSSLLYKMYIKIRVKRK